jgi:GNAT superfamily N-acetyltransferase
MGLEVGVCTTDEWTTLLACLDEEFVFKKKRSLSLVRRFPHTFDISNLNQIYVARSADAISAGVAIRLFDWYTPSRIWRGAMVGGVYTRPEQRGKGIASSILQTIQYKLVESGVDFGVLWTTIPKFYETLGWQHGDIGLFGEYIPPMTHRNDNQSSACAVSSCDIGWLESVRSNWVPERVSRSAVDYSAIPLPANSVEMFLAKTASSNGYAVVGRAESVGYVYELIGHPSTFKYLWSDILQGFDRLYVNDRRDSLSYNWLANMPDIRWKPQHLAMWLPFSEDAGNANLENWYIPYLDRI